MQWLIGFWLGWAIQTTEFSSYWDVAWTSSQRGDFCLLEQQIPGYGAARFSASPGQPMIFELLGHRDLAAGGAMAANQVAPGWHPHFPDEQPLAVLEPSPGTSLTAQDPAASLLLVSLYDGYEVELRHGAFYGPPGSLWLRIGAIRMRPAYREFMQCWQGEGGLGWMELARTRVHFDWDVHKLTTAAKQRLETIARAIAMDPGIKRVYIDGHTDVTGSDAYNNQLSARRARVVAKLLQQSGVPEDRLVVRHHAHRYPVADDATEQGRADNRRTTVRLERDQ